MRAFPWVTLWVRHLQVKERCSCITAQRSTRIKKKSKSVPEAIRSIGIKESAEKKKFPVFNEIKNGDPLQFQTSIERSRREVGIKEHTPSMLLKTKES